MLRTLRENWIWIVAPIVIVAALALIAFLLRDDTLQPGVYTL